MQEDKGSGSGLIPLLQRVMRDLLGMIILSILVYNLIQCDGPNYKQPEREFNGADTLKIMIQNDSITSIKPYKQ